MFFRLHGCHFNISTTKSAIHQTVISILEPKLRMKGNSIQTRMLKERMTLYDAYPREVVDRVEARNGEEDEEADEEEESSNMDDSEFIVPNITGVANIEKPGVVRKENRYLEWYNPRTKTWRKIYHFLVVSD